MILGWWVSLYFCGSPSRWKSDACKNKPSASITSIVVISHTICQICWFICMHRLMFVPFQNSAPKIIILFLLFVTFIFIFCVLYFSNNSLIKSTWWCWKLLWFSVISSYVAAMDCQHNLICNAMLVVCRARPRALSSGRAHVLHVFRDPGKAEFWKKGKPGYQLKDLLLCLFSAEIFTVL